MLSSGGNFMSRYFATFDRRTRQRCILARAEADLQWQQCIGGARGSWLAGRAHHDRPALSAVGWAMDLSRHCDRSTGCEVAAEVRHVAQLSLELVEVNVLGCWLPRRSETCKQWIRGGWGTRVTGTSPMYALVSVRVVKSPDRGTFMYGVLRVSAHCE